MQIRIEEREVWIDGRVGSGKGEMDVCHVPYFLFFRSLSLSLSVQVCKRKCVDLTPHSCYSHVSRDLHEQSSSKAREKKCRNFPLVLYIVFL